MKTSLDYKSLSDKDKNPFNTITYGGRYNYNTDKIIVVNTPKGMLNISKTFETNGVDVELPSTVRFAVNGKPYDVTIDPATGKGSVYDTTGDYIYLEPDTYKVTEYISVDSAWAARVNTVNEFKGPDGGYYSGVLTPGL